MFIPYTTSRTGMSMAMNVESQSVYDFDFSCTWCTYMYSIRWTARILLVYRVLQTILSCLSLVPHLTYTLANVHHLHPSLFRNSFIRVETQLFYHPTLPADYTQKILLWEYQVQIETWRSLCGVCPPITTNLKATTTHKSWIIGLSSSSTQTSLSLTSISGTLQGDTMTCRRASQQESRYVCVMIHVRLNSIRIDKCDVMMHDVIHRNDPRRRFQTFPATTT